MGCSSASPTWPSWPARREFALSNGADAVFWNLSRSIGMTSFSRILSAAGLALSLALTAIPAQAQQPKAPATAAPPPLKDASPAAIAAAKEILKMKNAAAMYANAVPNIVLQTKEALVQANLNYQKDLNEVAAIVAKNL